MTLLLAFFYVSVLIVGGLGGWALRRLTPPGGNGLGWVMVLFPPALALAILLKPHGPALWLRCLPGPHLWDRMVVGTVVLLVGLRGLWEIVDVLVGWAHLRNDTIPGRALAPWLDYPGMALRVGVKAPELRIHHALRSPVVVGWREPVILYPGRLVPQAYRDGGPFWNGVEVAGAAPELVRAMLFHELEHVRRRDHLKLALLVLDGCLLPWEWIAGGRGPGRSVLARWPVVAWVAPLFRALGAPFRSGMEAERARQETLADAAVHAYLRDGREWLRKARDTSGGTELPGGVGVLEVWRPCLVAALACGFLGIAPGHSTVRYAWEGKVTYLLDLPKTWSLSLEPGFGKASAGLCPGEGGKPGTVHVHIEELVPGHWPQLIGTGHFDLSELPDQGWVELIWDIQREGGNPEGGRLNFLLAAFRMVLDTRQDGVSVEAAPCPPPEALGGNRYRFRRRIALGTGQAGSSWLYLRYVFQEQGRWAFEPPVLAIVTPDGRRQPFPCT